MVINQRSNRAKGQPNTEPDRLAPDEKIDVPVTVARESARAKKHDDTDDEHAEHGEKQNVGAFTVHRLGRDLGSGLFQIG